LPAGSVYSCNILNNGSYACFVAPNSYPYDVIDAGNNWWGVSDSAAIEDLVFHFNDSAVCARLDYRPWATEFLYFNDSIPTDVAVTDNAVLPADYVLHQNYPNPFNGGTRIAFELKRAAEVNLTVYDILGRKTRELAARRMSPGTHEVSFDGLDARGRELASGVYFYVLRAGDFHRARKMVLLR